MSDTSQFIVAIVVLIGLLWLVFGGMAAIKEGSTPDKDTEPTEDEAVRLLRQIEKNTSATHFWTRVTGIPVLLGMIAGFLVALEKCN